MANDKHGRNKNSPSMKRYNAEKRWEKNAKRREQRHLKRMDKKAAKLAKRAENKKPEIANVQQA